MTTVLVTGALGVIGSRLVPFLRDAGYDVKGLDTHVRRARDYMRADVTSMAEMGQAFKQWKPDYILHLAAEFGREHSELFARRTVETNVVGTINVCQLCRDNGTRLILASSSEVYGDIGERFMVEALPPGRPTNVYGLSKFQAEQYLSHFIENYGLEAHIIRMFMCYGPGEYPSYYRSAISRFIYNALQRRPVTVHRGTHRSWCYIDDIVEGWRRVIEHFEPRRCEVYNIGRHDPKPMEDVARLIFRLAGASEELLQFSDPPRFVTPVKNASFEKAAKRLGFSAKLPLEEGLHRTIEWQRTAVTDPNIEC